MLRSVLSVAAAVFDDVWSGQQGQWAHEGAPPAPCDEAQTQELAATWCSMHGLRQPPDTSGVLVDVCGAVLLH